MEDGEGLASFMGWFSVGLGAMQLIAPRKVTRLIGLSPSGRSSAIMRVMGLREISHGVGILADPRSSGRIATRIGGDVLDLALVGVALAKSEHPARTLLATAAVAGATVLDVLGTGQLARETRA